MRNPCRRSEIWSVSPCSSDGSLFDAAHVLRPLATRATRAKMRFMRSICCRARRTYRSEGTEEIQSDLSAPSFFVRLFADQTIGVSSLPPICRERAMPSQSTGLLYALGAFTIFAVQDGISKHLGQYYPPVFVVMVRYWAFAVFAVILAGSDRSRRCSSSCSR